MEILTLTIGVLSVIVFSYCVYLLTHDKPSKREIDNYDAQKTLGI